MSRRKAPRPEPLASRAQLLALGLLAVALLVVFFVARDAVRVRGESPLLAWLPIGVHGQHVYPYHPEPQWRALPALLWASLLLVAAVAFVFLWPRKLARLHALAVVAVMVLGSLRLLAGTAMAPKLFPGIQLAWPFLWRNTEGAYVWEVQHARPVARFVSDYVHRLDVSPIEDTPHWVRVHHAQVHPPGLIAAFAGLEGLYDALPRWRAAVLRWSQHQFPALAELREHTMAALENPYGIRHPFAVALTAAMVTTALTALTPLVAFVAARELLPTRPALMAAGLCALLPGTHLFNPSVDQAYPALTLLVSWLAFRTARTRHWGWAFPFGVAVYGVMFIHVGYALAVAMLGVSGLVAWRSARRGWDVAQVAGAYWRPAVAAALGFFTPAFVLQLWLGYPTIRVVLACLRNNGLFNAAAGRTYWPWVAVVPFEFGVSLGFALLLVAAAGWGAEVLRCAKQRSLGGATPLLLGSASVLLVVYLLGLNRGETARLWLFLTPLVVLGAAEFIQRRVAEPRQLLAAVGGAQLAQLLVFAVVLDMGRTTEFVVGRMAGQ